MLAMLGIAAALVPVPAGVVAGFELPSGNIDCNAGPYRGKPLVACTVFSLEDPKRGQKVWALSSTGRVSVGFVLGNAATGYRKLAYGKTWTFHTIRCKSTRRGLTCRNPAGHGFFLSRQSQRVF